jgi:hypothetical protein
MSFKALAGFEAAGLASKLRRSTPPAGAGTVFLGAETLVAPVVDGGGARPVDGAAATFCAFFYAPFLLITSSSLESSFLFL